MKNKHINGDDAKIHLEEKQAKLRGYEGPEVYSDIVKNKCKYEIDLGVLLLF